MGEESARKDDSGEKETDDTDRTPAQTPAEGATGNRSENPGGPAGNVQKTSRLRPGQPSTVGTESSGRKRGTRGTGEEYVNYEPGPDARTLASRYRMDVRQAEAAELQRLEQEFGRDRVSRWAEEGMTVETMGKPRDMQAFRERQEARPRAVPVDVEQRNEASVQRNAGRNQQAAAAGETGVPDEVRRVISSPGRSMDDAVRRKMESKMGGDFSDVRVHTGPKAVAAAESIDARAFTVGNHVAFNSGEYQPDSSSGEEILAHELTHVRQQTEGAVSLLPKAKTDPPGAGGTVDASIHVQPNLAVSSPDDPAEKQAERIAKQVVEMDEPARQAGDGSGDRTDRSSRTPDHQDGRGVDTFASTDRAIQRKAAEGGEKQSELEKKAAEVQSHRVKGRSTLFDVTVPITPAFLRLLYGEEIAQAGGGGEKASSSESSGETQTVARQSSEQSDQGETTSIGPGDIDQGALGDCYFLAAAAAIARERPDLIDSLITPIDGGKFYQVTLYPEVYGGNVDVVEVLVTPKVPGYGWVGKIFKGRWTKYAGPGKGQGEVDEEELWPMLLEKAFAKYMGQTGNVTYQAISGGHADQAMQMLGATDTTSSDPLNDMNRSTLISTVESALNSETSVIVADTVQNAGSAVVRGHDVSPSVKATEVLEKGPIITSHSYAIASIDDDSITVDNPHGPGNQISLPINEFRTVFEEIHIGEVPGEWVTGG